MNLRCGLLFLVGFLTVIFTSAGEENGVPSQRSKITLVSLAPVNLGSESDEDITNAVRFRHGNTTCLVLVFFNAKLRSFDPQHNKAQIRCSLMQNNPEFNNDPIVLFFQRINGEDMLLDAVRIRFDNSGKLNANFVEAPVYVKLSSAFN